MPDVVGPRHVGGRGLGGLVGVEGPLVVGVLARAQRRAGHVDVEVLQLHAEGGDVLLGEPLDRLELGLALTARLALLRVWPAHDGDGRRDRPAPRAAAPCLHGDQRTSRTPRRPRRWGTCRDVRCQTRAMTTDERIEVSRPSTHPRRRLRRALRSAGPRRHRRVRHAPGRRGRAGHRGGPDSFVVHMDREALGDLDLGRVRRHGDHPHLRARPRDRVEGARPGAPADRPRLRLPRSSRTATAAASSRPTTTGPTSRRSGARPASSR